MSSGYCKRLVSGTLITAAAVLAVAASARPALADPPARVARVSVLNGPVSFRPASTDDWDNASLNYPLTIGDHLWTDRNARAEVDLGSAAVRLGALTDLGILNLDDGIVQLRLTSGTIHVHLRDGWSDAFELDTPNGAVSLLTPGTYRVDVNPNGDASTVTVRRGQASVVAGGYSYPVRGQETMELDGFDAPRTQLRDAIAIDAFEDWCIARDRREDTAVSARYIPQDVVGYSDLDDYGSWTNEAEYGAVWMPRVRADWAPYRDGRWVWIDPWGWTWVDAEPWGFAPFHYGRWVSLRGGWGWVPGRFVERPVYAPALVAFVGGPGWSASFAFGSEPVCWFPLGPREPYVPAYRVSDRYVRSINRPHVNVTNINVTNIRYVNRDVPGAVTAVPRDAFVRSRPVNGAALAVSRDTVRSGAIVGHAAPIAPQPRAEVRDQRPRVATPPAAVLNRPVVGRRQAPAQGQPRGPQPQYVPPQQAAPQQPAQQSPQQPPVFARPTRPQRDASPAPQQAPQPEPQRARPRDQQQTAPPPEPQRSRPRDQQQTAPPQQAPPQQQQPPAARGSERRQPPPEEQKQPERARPQDQPRREQQPQQQQPQDQRGHGAQSGDQPQRPTSRRPPR